MVSQGTHKYIQFNHGNTNVLIVFDKIIFEYTINSDMILDYSVYGFELFKEMRVSGPTVQQPGAFYFR